MSDDKRQDEGRHDRDEDRWTQGPELTPEQARRERQAGSEEPVPPAESAEALRERQRLAQLEMLDRWVDGVLVEQRRSRRWKLFFRFFFIVLILASLAAIFYGVFGDPTSEPERQHLGVVKVEGVIDSESPASAERIIEGLNRAWDSPNAAAVVLHINSPGGSPVQSQRVYNEILRLREEGDKPIIAVIEDVGASGAYYMAAAADEIVAAPASLVGSIGVIFASFGFEEAIERLGIERRIYVSGENKDFLDPFSEVDPEVRDFWQGVMDITHGQFIEAVRQGRGERLVEDERLFSGLVWSGQQALELGLIDGISSLDALSRELFGELRLHNYTPRLDPFERLSRQFGRVAAEWAGLPSSRAPVRYQLP
ncbi:signal peptide peptidase SppA [Halomonas sp. MCCC 1A17488]|uniref:Signal peptide peptidase SppA n=1 Tax=Billgrantia sulfidoxydans TaxID=2733484 RepID=A0ABX7W2I7_9GAMM|nr:MULTISPECIES: signal peptide peptidase SppA [Halomonas]MCE8015669.1 signal peptide peptidase SppA [Halomonas sp. MCCC 1A17488]MCG3239002.1 signal peptide peptidase SppA [Halomonas sp. MCCC 1A17488]QPP51047.1 signal peptide peptidase SppA [Halomonas sp. SS10-MC5]QTP54559.1 signal peptide peptidase SppA [Halomonas sulfidoxydans]